MATAAASGVEAALLTYEEYLTEGEINRRYDIIEGVRVYMSSPTWKHQRAVFRLTQILGKFEEESGQGVIVPAPSDVLIRRRPLQVRQPDVLFISHARLAQIGGPPDGGVLEVAPELVVEVLSPSETRRDREDKIRDYTRIGVSECWVVDLNARAVESLLLLPAGPQTRAVYAEGETLCSAAFPELTALVADVFAP